MLDEYLIGDYIRNSPEAEVPIINYSYKEQRLGGAANVALNLKSLGMEPILVSIVGDDEAGKNLIRLCTENQISHEFIQLPDRPTTLKQRIVDVAYKQYLRVDYETTEYLQEAIEDRVHSVLMQQLNRNIEAVVLQDYNKGLMTASIISATLDFCNTNNIPSFADPKHKNFELLTKATVFKPNLKELLINKGIQNLDETKLDEVLNSYSAFKKLLFVTLGDKGIYYKDAVNEVNGHIPGLSVSEADVSGAGDTVLSALVYAYLLSTNAIQMAEMANKAGASVCSKKGVSRITLTDLEL